MGDSMELLGREGATDHSEELTFLWLEITGQCNLTCIHCYADSGPSAPLRAAMSISDWTRVIDEAAEIGCRQIQFIGGEPTLHPDLEIMIDRARAKGFEFVEVFTNATRISKQLVGTLRRYDVHVASSFYSHNPEVHDRITQRLGSWRRTVAGIGAILAAGIPTRVGIVEMDENVHDTPQTRAFLHSMGVVNVGSDRMRGIGRADGARDRGANEERFEELCGKCAQGKLCVSASGTAFPCVFSRATPLGNVKNGLRPIVGGTALHAFRKQMQKTHGRSLARAFTEQTAECTPYCNPNCSPDCMPNCNPNCNPDCMPNCYPNCNPDRR